MWDSRCKKERKLTVDCGNTNKSTENWLEKGICSKKEWKLTVDCGNTNKSTENDWEGGC